MWCVTAKFLGTAAGCWVHLVLLVIMTKNRLRRGKPQHSSLAEVGFYDTKNGSFFPCNDALTIDPGLERIS